MSTQPTQRRRLLRAGVFGLLLASLAANVFLALALQRSFAKLHELRNFPLGFVPAAAASGGVQEARNSLAIWGDSRAMMWDAHGLDNTLRVLNNAHGGITSSQLVLQLQTAPDRRTQYAVVQIGINDLHPLGALGARRERILADLRINLARVRDALAARSDVVVLTTIVPPGPVPWWRWTTWDPRTMDDLVAVNALIRGMADGRRVLVLDAAALLRGGDGRLDPRFQDDDFFLHLNPAAYARLNEALLRLLARPGAASS